ncbi:hypothetical protein [Arthrobacter gyeryongensis]
MSHRYHRRLQAVLAGHGDTHAIDLPGFGGTPKPDRQITVAECAEVIAGTLAAIGCQRLAAIVPEGRFLEIPGKPHVVQHGAPVRMAAGILAISRV